MTNAVVLNCTEKGYFGIIKKFWRYNNQGGGVCGGGGGGGEREREREERE